LSVKAYWSEGGSPFSAELEGDGMLAMQYMKKASLVFENDKMFLAFIQEKIEGLNVKK
jgi:hypothetical protein